jgi:DNA polymerase-4
LEVTPDQVPAFMAQLPVRKIWGIGPATEKRIHEMGISTCGELQRFSRIELQQLFARFGIELYDLARGIDTRSVEPDRPRKSLSTEETFSSDLESLPQCAEQVGQLFEELMAELAQKEPKRAVTKIFLKLKFNDFTRTTVERAGLGVSLESFQALLNEGYVRSNKPVRLIGLGVRFAEDADRVDAQLSLL